MERPPRTSADLARQARFWSHRAGEAAALVNAAKSELRGSSAGNDLAVAALQAAERRMRTLCDELQEFATEAGATPDEP